MGLNFTIFNDLAETFQCAHCLHKGGTTQFFIYGSSENACIACPACGFVEIYEYHILDEKYSVLN